MKYPLHCVVDTNVATTANGANPGASADCVYRSGRALDHALKKAHVYLDDAGAIVNEYRSNLSAKGEPGMGDVFFKWLLRHEWNPSKVTRVRITPREDDPEDYQELPPPTPPIRYDRSDKKFLAVAAAHRRHPAILQSFDSKWWGWQEELAKVRVKIVFLCEDEIQSKHQQKMGS